MDLGAWRLSYNQDIDTQSTQAETPHAPIIQNGHLKVRLPNVWASGATSFTEEFRGYFPTSTLSRDAGMVTELRNYFSFTHKISPSVSFSLSEVPMLHVYNDAGYTSAQGTFANPIFENRGILSFDFQLSPTVSFSMPLHFYVRKFRDYLASAANNAEWQPLLFLWPELRWSLTPNFTLGTAYRTNSLFTVDETGTVPGEGGGAFQGIVGLSF